jgi:nitrite reductase/ring-hydroxylating ferredoxin subunit
VSTRVALCEEHELPEGKTRGFHVQGRELILLRHEGRVHAYENRCPHRGTTLDWVEGRFMSPDGSHLQCATHGALFRLHDGLCVAGPCSGDSLNELELCHEAGAIFVLL